MNISRDEMKANIPHICLVLLVSSLVLFVQVFSFVLINYSEMSVPR